MGDGHEYFIPGTIIFKRINFLKTGFVQQIEVVKLRTKTLSLSVCAISPTQLIC